jgi:glutathione S-transferase
MSYTLVLGQKNYSSWSMRAWLALRHLGLPFEEVTVGVYTDESRATVRALGGETGLVPVLKTDGMAIWDTLAIFEFLHEAHGGLWPTDPAQRARARSLAGELHSGFTALREAMPVNTRARGRSAVRTPQVEADIARAASIWNAYPQAGTPWLFGAFGAADILFAPVATRFLTYGVELTGPARAYQDAVLAHPLIAEWMVLGAAETDVVPILEVG